MPSENNSSLFGFFSLLFSVVTTIGFASQTDSDAPADQTYSSISIEEIEVDSIASLRNVFNNQQHSWPPSNDTGKYIALSRLPESFSNIKDTREKKRLFIQMLLPIAQIENRRVVQQRNIALLLLKDNKWPKDKTLLKLVKDITAEYRVTTKSATNALRILSQRVDRLPSSLIIAQAAIESGWGSSRFALEGNSLFGQWSFEEDSGLVPQERGEGLTHQVKAFKDIRESVRAYILNINTNQAYRELRNTRAEMRNNYQKADALKLAEGLHRYSQRKQEYVEEIKKILRSKDFRAITASDS